MGSSWDGIFIEFNFLCMLNKLRWEIFQNKSLTLSLQAIIANRDLQHYLEFECYQEDSLVPGARPLSDFN